MVKTVPVAKPDKPYPGFPLFPHASGRWAKKIKGRFAYFGRWSDDPKGERALGQYLNEKDALHAGHRPQRGGESSPTVADVCGDFLDAKQALLLNGEITSRTFYDYRRAADSIVDHFGKGRLVSDLAPSDFARLREKLAKRFGPTRPGNEIQRIKGVFKHALDSQLIDRAAAYGQSFKRPAQRLMRIARQRQGPRTFEADELRQILDAADVPMRAAVLLGVNAALGQSDVAALPKTAVDFASGWLVYPRGKTGIGRRIPLWPETIEALNAAIAQRPKPKAKAKADDRLVFLFTTGRPMVEVTKNGDTVDRLGKAFPKLVDGLGLKRQGVGFYGLRHTTATIGDGAKDRTALGAIMGHIDTSMTATYRETIEDDRLRAVVEHIRAWLFGLDKKMFHRPPEGV
ncbi:MAG: tyrosine-type recombinase/integrase [Planctomycetia bacterium]|nr:tyrosine-type recombinase/integrase [Planctomycetia bacterium]